MSEATEAVLFNGVPLLLLAAAYAAVTVAILPILWRERTQAHPLDWAVVLVFPGIAVAAAIFGFLVIHERRPLGGHVWLSFAACLVALAPAVLLLVRWRDRALVVGGIGRTRRAEERVSVRDRELEAVAEISNALARARTPADAARPLVQQVTALLGVGFAGVVVVRGEGDSATGVYAELNGEPAEWWEEVQVDLRSEPSGIASAVFDAAPVTVYDITSSPRVSPRLAAMVGAHSGAWVPMIAEERVVGVLVFASTDGKRTFPAEELALLQAIASEAALALERLRSAAALSDALAREQLIGEMARRIRAQLEPDEVVSVARDELRRALHLGSIAISVDDGADITSDRELLPGEQFVVDTVAREVDAALRTAGLLAENRRRLDQQAALLHAAQVVTSELEIEAVLERLVEEVTQAARRRRGRLLPRRRRARRPPLCCGAWVRYRRSSASSSRRRTGSPASRSSRPGLLQQRTTP